MAQKKSKTWAKYDVLELRGSTLGVVGYGDIGRACAKLAHVYGMRVVALRRNPTLAIGDPLCDKVLGSDTESLNTLFRESDYILCSAPLTEETRGLIGKVQFEQAKQDAVFINLGRGPVVDEDALIEALKTGKLKGAALDVYTVEPLPANSELWELKNVLLSPHNMDQTATFMHEATEFFVHENVPRFMRREPLLNPVNKNAGY
jgi:phosphoglycerate dehydrogenase-like enzyme